MNKIEIINAISNVILKELTDLGSESKEPRLDPDKSDDYIKQHTCDIQHLRRIRNELEYIFSDQGWKL